MAQNIYIKFNTTPESPEEKQKGQWFGKILKAVLFFIPQANPDYENLIGDVAEWLLEIDPEYNTPTRELGKDVNGKTIVIMPWLKNYGYWTDNEITLDYFLDHFKATYIDENEFEINWQEYVTKNSRNPNNTKLT